MDPRKDPQNTARYSEIPIHGSCQYTRYTSEAITPDASHALLGTRASMAKPTVPKKEPAR